jgi:hypothetical protein
LRAPDCRLAGTGLSPSPRPQRPPFP